MSSVPAWRRYLRFWRTDVAGDVEDELRFHLEERVEDLKVLGHSHQEAIRMAHDEFGSLDVTRSELTAIDSRLDERRRRRAWRDYLGGDLRYVLRSLRRSPGFAALVCLTFALGIGANAALFSFIDRVFFRSPSGLTRPSELVRLYWQEPRSGASTGPRVWTHYRFSYIEMHPVLDALPPTIPVALYAAVHTRMGNGESPPQAWVTYAGPGYFRILGAHAPALGRYLTDDESRIGRPTDAVVVGYDEWRTTFGGDSAIVGREIPVGDRRFRVVGVAPRGFTGAKLDVVAYWVPLGAFSAGRTPWYTSINSQPLEAVARVTGTARAALEALGTAAMRAGPPPLDSLSSLVTGPLQLGRGPMEPPGELLVSTRLVGVAVILLLIACANVANLLLARAVRRRREIAIRLALGISRTRLTVLLLSESLVLATLAAAAALLFTQWAGAALQHMLLPDAAWDPHTVDARVVAFTVAVTLLTVLLAGLTPALRTGRSGVATALRAGPRASGDRSRLRSGLVVAQAALSVVLLAGAGVFVRSLLVVNRVPTGYDVDRLLFVSLRFDDGSWSSGRAAPILLRLQEALAQSAIVERTAMAHLQPMTGISFNDLFDRDGKPVEQIGGRLPTFLSISPEFIATAGMRVVAGRGFDASDVALPTSSMLVNETMAKALLLQAGVETYAALLNGTACFHIDEPVNPCRTVVGVVSDVHSVRLLETNPTPQYYLSLSATDRAWGAGSLVVRTRGNSGDAQADVQRVVRPLLPAGVYARVEPMREGFNGELRAWRLGATLFTTFGVLALVVAAVGTYSTISYIVSGRTRELGVRIALGASPGNVLRLVIGDGVALAAIGVLMGIGLAALLGRFIASLLYETSPHDPAVLAAVSVVLLLTAAVASLVAGMEGVPHRSDHRAPDGLSVTMALRRLR